MSEYVLLNSIGQGSYGKVYLAQEKNAPETAKKLVVKEIDLRNASYKDRQAAHQEAFLLSKIKHPNVISYRDSFEKGKRRFLYIVMVFAEGGDLFTRIKNQRNIKSSSRSRFVYLPERQIVEWCVQIAMGLQYLHSKRILHRDLKTQNIFLTKSNLVKIGDLGIATVLDTNANDETLPACTVIGTPYYMSPEIFSGKSYNERSDMWAFGCCMYEMMSLRHAFSAKDIDSLVYQIMKKDPPVFPSNTYNPLLENLARRMFQRDPMKRYTATQFLKHPYIKLHIHQFLHATQEKLTKKEAESSRNISDKTVVVPKGKSIAKKLNLSLEKVESLKIEEPEEKFEFGVPAGGNETLASSTKILDRIVELRKECLEIVGITGLSKVYQIIDNYIGDQHLTTLELKLRTHLGDEKFDRIGVKIWQLKFFEEQLFC